MLRAAAELCRERRDDLARFMALEMGKRIVEGREEVELCARIFDYYAEQRRAIPEAPDHPVAARRRDLCSTSRSA